MAFNQALNVPEFTDNKSKRRLVSMDSLNVARDIIDFIFVSNEESDKSPVKYYLSIEEWTRDHMTVFMNITDPLRVSQGKVSDKLLLIVKNKYYFTSEVTGEPIEEIEMKSSVPFKVPRQLPKSISEEEMKDQVSSASNSL